MKNFWSLEAQVWRDDLDDEWIYYVAQSFDEGDGDSEILAHGAGVDEADARKQVFQAIGEISR